MEYEGHGKGEYPSDKINQNSNKFEFK